MSKMSEKNKMSRWERGRPEFSSVFDRENERDRKDIIAITNPAKLKFIVAPNCNSPYIKIIVLATHLYLYYTEGIFSCANLNFDRWSEMLAFLLPQ